MFGSFLPSQASSSTSGMGENIKYGYDGEEGAWAGGSIQHFQPPLQSDSYPQYSTFISPACVNEVEAPQQSVVLFPIPDLLWNIDDTGPDSGYLPEDIEEYPILPYESSESISSGGSTLASPLDGVLETLFIDFHAPALDTLPDTQHNQVIRNSNSESSKRPSIKPRWTSQQLLRSSSEQLPTTIPQQNLNDRARPPILNSEPSFRHNLVERKYRSKLNNEYETLLAVLPPHLVAEVNDARRASKQPEKSISKSEVLGLAKEHIEMLEKEGMELEMQRKALAAEVERMKEIWMSSVSEGENY